MKLKRDESAEGGGSGEVLPIRAIGRALGLDPDLVEEAVSEIRGGKHPSNWLNRLNPDDPETLANLAIILKGSGQVEEVERLLRRAVDLDPTRVISWTHLGALLLARDDFDESRICFERVIDLDSEAAAGWFGMGMLYLKEGKYENAVKHLDRAKEIEPESRAVWIFRGLALSSIGDPIDRCEEAIASFQEALALDPKDGATWRHMGVVYLKMCEYSKAALALKKASRLIPGDPEIWYLRGHAQCMLKKYKNALRYLDTATDLDPGYSKAWEEKGHLLETMGRKDEAKEALSLAKQLEEEGGTSEALTGQGER